MLSPHRTIDVADAYRSMGGFTPEGPFFNRALISLIWSLIVGTQGILDGSWGVLGKRIFGCICYLLVAKVPGSRNEGSRTGDMSTFSLALERHSHSHSRDGHQSFEKSSSSW